MANELTDEAKIDQLKLRASVAECNSFMNGIAAAEAQARAGRFDLKIANENHQILVQELHSKYEADDKNIFFDRPKVKTE